MPAMVRAGLAEAIKAYRDLVPGARWTSSESWHVTIKFLGATWPRLVEDVKGSVCDVAAAIEPFHSALTELGAFPSARRARVLWAGLDDPDGRFAAAARALDESLAEHFAAEKRPLTPHLTIARINPPRDLRELAEDLSNANVASARFSVDRLVLYRSHLSPRGATYESLGDYLLGG